MILTLIFLVLFVVFLVVAVRNKEYKGGAFWLYCMIGLLILVLHTRLLSLLS